MTIMISDDEKGRLMKPVRGQGGWQRLLRRLQSQLNGNTLRLTAKDLDMVRKYLDRYGDGGWQKRLGFLKRVQLDSAA